MTDPEWISHEGCDGRIAQLEADNAVMRQALGQIEAMTSRHAGFAAAAVARGTLDTVGRWDCPDEVSE